MPIYYTYTYVEYTSRFRKIEATPSEKKTR